MNRTDWAAEGVVSSRVEWDQQIYLYLSTKEGSLQSECTLHTIKTITGPGKAAGNGYVLFISQEKQILIILI